MAADLSIAPREPVSAAVHRFLTSLSRPGRLLVALSGGSDSLGLLLALHEALQAGDFPDFSLSACTVDHGLRPESASEAERVAAYCAGIGIPHTIVRWDGDKPATGVPAAARAARYSLLTEEGLRQSAVCAVLGHTRDDQRETIAMRAARSSDRPETTGAAGMADAVLHMGAVWFVRPFLGVCRSDIRAWLAARGEAWIDDPSNSDARFERVRVRAGLAGHRDDHVTDSGSIRAQGSLRAAQWIARHVRLYGASVAGIASGIDAAVSDPDCRRGLSLLAAVLGGRTFQMAQASEARIIDFLRTGTVGRMSAGRVVFDLRRNALFLYREARDLPCLVLSPDARGLWDGRLVVANGSAFEITVCGQKAVHDGFADALIAAGVPAGVAKRAGLAAPAVALSGKDAAGHHGNAGQFPHADVLFQWRISPYDTFLPRFDLTIGNELARLFARPDYRSCPIGGQAAEK